MNSQIFTIVVHLFATAVAVCPALLAFIPGLVAMMLGILVLWPTQLFPGIDLIPGSISIIAGSVACALAQSITKNNEDYERTTATRWGLRFLAYFLGAVIIAVPGYWALRGLLQQAILREKRKLEKSTKENAYLKKVVEKTRIIWRAQEMLEREKEKMD